MMPKNVFVCACAFITAVIILEAHLCACHSTDHENQEDEVIWIFGEGVTERLGNHTESEVYERRGDQSDSEAVEGDNYHRHTEAMEDHNTSESESDESHDGQADNEDIDGENHQVDNESYERHAHQSESESYEPNDDHDGGEVYERQDSEDEGEVYDRQDSEDEGEVYDRQDSEDEGEVYDRQDSEDEGEFYEPQYYEDEEEVYERQDSESEGQDSELSEEIYGHQDNESEVFESQKSLIEREKEYLLKALQDERAESSYIEFSPADTCRGEACYPRGTEPPILRTSSPPYTPNCETEYDVRIARRVRTYGKVYDVALHKSQDNSTIYQLVQEGRCKSFDARCGCDGWQRCRQRYRKIWMPVQSGKAEDLVPVNIPSHCECRNLLINE